MPTIAQRIASKLARSRPAPSLADQLATRRGDALGQWRLLVESAAAGGEVSLEQIETIANTLRIDDVAAAFESDVAAARAMAEARADLARDEQISREVCIDAEKAVKELVDLRGRLADLERRSAAPQLAAGAVAFARGRIATLEDECPRLYAEATLARHRTADAPAVSPAEVSALALGVKVRPATVSDEATWEPE
jgi:hypothetical protein